MDLATFEREAARQNGEPAAPLTAKDAEDYRCQTLPGRPISQPPPSERQPLAASVESFSVCPT